MNQDFYYKLVSGQNKGCIAVLINMLLAVAAKGYMLVIKLRNFLYDKSFFKTHHCDTTVICVGNITLGGTGKTPLVIWLCKLLQQHNVPCAILTRGYKTTQNPKPGTQNLSDEPAILTESCPQAKVIVNPDRIAGASEAIHNFGVKVLIMDDGFQHRRLGRDLDIVTIDATRPFGYEKIFPAGLLREHMSSLKRAHAVIITRSDQIAEPELDRIEHKLKTFNPDLILARSIHTAVCVRTYDNKNIDIEYLNGKKLFAFCGIGNPDAFFNTLRALGAKLAGSKIFNDHYLFTEACLDDIYKHAQHAEADMILTTQKDWTKIGRLTVDIQDIPLAYLVVDLKFIAGEDKLRSLINHTLKDKISKKNKN
jgi:tetraacyldisaccharide 4'-kinase